MGTVRKYGFTPGATDAKVFERYKRMTGDVEEAVLEMYLSGISVRK